MKTESDPDGLFAFHIDFYGRRVYVAQFPGDDGVDWGYTRPRRLRKQFDKPVRLSREMQKLFASDMLHCRREALFTDTDPDVGIVWPPVAKSTKPVLEGNDAPI